MTEATRTELTPGQCALIGFYFEQIHAPLIRFTARLTESRADAEDIASETYLQLMCEVACGKVVLESEPLRGQPGPGRGAPPALRDRGVLRDRPVRRTRPALRDGLTLRDGPALRDGMALPGPLAPHDRIAAWLYHTATNKAFNLERSRRREGGALEHLARHPFAGDPDKIFTRERRREHVVAALLRISRLHRFLLYAHACGYSYQELAEIEGVPFNTIASLMLRARAAFRRLYLGGPHRR